MAQSAEPAAGGAAAKPGAAWWARPPSWKTWEAGGAWAASTEAESSSRTRDSRFLAGMSRS
jgi:hypothetical protein